MGHLIRKGKLGQMTIEMIVKFSVRQAIRQFDMDYEVDMEKMMDEYIDAGRNKTDCDFVDMTALVPYTAPPPPQAMMMSLPAPAAGPRSHRSHRKHHHDA